MPDITSRDKFIKIYANLPLPERDEVIYVDDSKGPISWNVSFVEIKNETEFGKSILQRLEELNII